LAFQDAALSPNAESVLLTNVVRALMQPSALGCINVRTTVVGKSLFVFENKASVYRTLGLLSTLPSVGR